MALFVISLNFLQWNLPKFLQHIAFHPMGYESQTQKSSVCTGSFFNSCKFMSFTTVKNLVLQISLKTNFNLSKLFTTNNCLSHFTEFYQGKDGKIHSQFCFLYSCQRHNIWKNTDIFRQPRVDYLSFRLQCGCDDNIIGSHLKCDMWPTWGRYKILEKRVCNMDPSLEIV